MDISKRFLKLALAFLVFSSFQSCSSPSNNPVAQTPVKGTDAKPKKGVTGILVDQKRKPVEHSMVEALLGGSDIDPTQSTSSARVVDSVVTDDQGRYSFDSLPTGSYTLNGNFQNGSLVVLIRNIKYQGGDSLLEVPTDTLRAPGKISGRAVLLEQDNGGILAYVPGTSFLALTDDSGAFILSNIPQGKYTLAYRKEGLKTAKDTAVVITSGQNTVLPTKNMEADPAFPPPAPSNLRVTYDTITGVATLRWKPVSVSDLDGYLIYRNDTSQVDPQKLPNLLVKDTVYRDSLFTDFKNVYDLVKVYRIKSQDLEANVSTNFSKPAMVKEPSPANVRTIFSFGLQNTKDDSASVNDFVSITLSYSNKNRRNSRIQWYVDKTDSVVQSRKDSSFSGGDSLRRVWNHSGKHTILVSATDDGNSTWWDSIPINIVQDPPIVNAGKDTTVSINDTINCHGSASDLFGRIVLMEWSIGGGPFAKTTRTDTTIFAPPIENLSYPIIFRATDDDGNVVADTAIVRVEKDPPVAKITAPDSVRVDSLYTLKTLGSSPGKFGKIVKYEWSIGSSSNFIVSSGDTSLRAPSPDYDSLKVILKVTDEDGNIAIDSKNIHFYRKWEYVGTPGISKSGASSPALAFDANTPYIAYSDMSNGNLATVMRFDGLSWQFVGAPGFSKVIPAKISITISNGTPYVLFNEVNTYKLSVMRYDGSSWVPVGLPGFATGGGNDPSLSINSDSGNLYVAYTYGGKGKILKFDGSSWISVGAPNFSLGVTNQDGPKLGFSSGTPYVAYGDLNNGTKATLMRFDGASWIPVGTPGFTNGKVSYFSFQIHGNSPYIAYGDQSNSGITSLMWFDGVSWVTLGNPGFSISGYIWSPGALGFDGDSPYVAFVGGQIWRLDKNIWVKIANQNLTNLEEQVKFNSKTPYWVFTASPNYKASVMVYR